MAVVQLQAWCYNSCSCRGLNTSTLRIPLIKYLYLSICHSPTPHARSCSYVPAYMSEFAYCSTRMLCHHNACRTHRGDRNIHRPLMSRLNTFHGTQSTNFSTPAPMNELITFQHLHSGYEFFFPTPAAANFLHLCNFCSSWKLWTASLQHAKTCMRSHHYMTPPTCTRFHCFNSNW